MTPRRKDTSGYEALLEFLYLTPVGIIKFHPGGAIELANPEAARLLIPLAQDGGMADIYRLLADAIPDLRRRLETFRGLAGPIGEQSRITVPGSSTVLTIDINKINRATCMAVVQDITNAIAQSNRIRGDQRRFHAIFENIRDCAICTVDLDGRIEGWNRSLQRLGGWDKADVTGAALDLFFPPAALSPGATLLTAATATGTARTEHWAVRKDGSTFWSNTIVTALPDNQGRASGFVVVTHDLTDRKLIEDRLRAFATTDPLTGASNRRAGEERLADAVTQARRTGRPFVALMLDCDHFKSVNDRFGHEGGDAVLIALVRLCRENIRETDATIRWGGEEFLLVLPDTSLDTALPVAERLRQAIAEATVGHAGRTIQVTVSIGAAQSNDTDSGPRDVVRRADAALYRAKTAGRDRIAVDTAPPDTRLLAAL